MGVKLLSDHGESGLYLSQIDWDSSKTVVEFRFYKNRATTGSDDQDPELFGYFRFATYGENGFQSNSGTISEPPWDGNPSMPKNLARAQTDFLELTDIPFRSEDAKLTTLQEAPWTWAGHEHNIRLTLDGYLDIDFTVYFVEPQHPIDWSGTWTLMQDYR